MTTFSRGFIGDRNTSEALLGHMNQLGRIRIPTFATRNAGNVKHQRLMLHMGWVSWICWRIGSKCCKRRERLGFDSRRGHWSDGLGQLRAGGLIEKDGLLKLCRCMLRRSFCLPSGVASEHIEGESKLRVCLRLGGCAYASPPTIRDYLVQQMRRLGYYCCAESSVSESDGRALFAKRWQ